MDWPMQGKKNAWDTFRKESGESARRHPERRRKHKAKQEQEMQILEWAIDGIFQKVSIERAGQSTPAEKTIRQCCQGRAGWPPYKNTKQSENRHML